MPSSLWLSSLAWMALIRPYTALIAAAWKGHEGCVRLLMEAGADSSIKEIDDNTALDLASTEAIKAILRS